VTNEEVSSKSGGANCTSRSKDFADELIAAGGRIHAETYDPVGRTHYVLLVWDESAAAGKKAGKR
jgi:hypothetical protein